MDKLCYRRSWNDVDLFEAHSTRSAASSYAKQNDTMIDDIMITAGQKNNKTFYGFMISQ